VALFQVWSQQQQLLLPRCLHGCQLSQLLVKPCRCFLVCLAHVHLHAAHGFCVVGLALPLLQCQMILLLGLD
jgi:hypothetical protein